MKFVFMFAAVLLALLPFAAKAQIVANVLNYRLDVDDLIEVSVPNHADLRYAGPVPPGGKISLPEIGVVTLVGKTCSQLEAELQKKITEFRNSVTVDVILLEARSKMVQIVGSTLKTQGKYTMRPGWRLFDLVAAAGGIGAKPNKVNAKLVRNGKLVQLNFLAASDKPDSDDNVLLQPGDMVLLDEVDTVHYFVSITGEGQKRSVVELDQDMDLYRLVLMGQPTEFSDLAKAHILRGTEEIPINLESIDTAKSDEKVTNFKLKPGDTVFIPRIETKFSVLGLVGKPGVYPLPTKKPVTVLDAYALVGGSQGGDPSRAGILRTTDKKPTIIAVNIDKMLKKSNLDKNIALKDGDILYIPPKGSGGFKLENLVTPLYLLRLFGI